MSTPNPATPRRTDESRAKPEAPLASSSAAPLTHATSAPATPRASLLEHLTASVHEAFVAGDLEAAKVAHDAIGRLLARPASTGEERSPGATVVDLEAERERRAAR